MINTWRAQGPMRQNRAAKKATNALVASIALAWLMASPASSANNPAGYGGHRVPAPALQNYRFDVYYNGKRIGEHEFRVDRDADEIRVQSTANFLFKLLFVPVYRYQHVAEERWLAGCLQTLVASTNDNGEYSEVVLQPGPNQAILSKLAPATSTVPLSDPCPASYAYWDLDLLRRGELINAQTGEVMPARLIDRGVEELDGVPARRFTLDAHETGTIDLWYRESDSQWIALETVRDGGTLSYRTDA